MAAINHFHVNRRTALVGLASLAASRVHAAQAGAAGQVGDSASLAISAHGAELASALRAGGCAVLLRHAQTEPGVGDPPGFTLGVCATQRNLSASGQADARRIGAWFRQHKIKPRAVLTSAWCRCVDTADLAFGQHTVWSALNSTFSDRVQQPNKTGLVRQALARIPPRQFEVWVTHQVNISALTGQGPAMGEAFVLDRQGAVILQTAFN